MRLSQVFWFHVCAYQRRDAGSSLPVVNYITAVIARTRVCLYPQVDKREGEFDAYIYLDDATNLHSE